MAGFHAVANNLLTFFGFQADLYNYNNTDFDVEQGEVIRSVSSQTQGLAVFTDLNAGELKEQSYSYYEGDKKILLNAPLDFVVNIDTSINIQGKYYKIAFISEVKDVLETALYKIVIREDAGFINPV